MVKLAMQAKKFIAGGIAVALLGAGGTYANHWWEEGRFLESTDNAYVEADMSVVASRVAGHVREVVVQDNQAVRAGDVLLKLDDKDLRSRVAEARARLDARRAALAALLRETRLQSSSIQKAQAELAGAEAERERTELDLARHNSLWSGRWVSRQRLEAVRAEARKAVAGASAAGASLKAETAGLSVIEARRLEAEAAVEEAQAALALAELDVQHAVVRAPIDGVVGNRAARVGQYVRPGTPLLVVAPLANVFVVANFKETQLERVRAGQPVTLKVDAFPGAVLTGFVDGLSPASGSRFSLLPPENATGNFNKVVQRIPVRIALRPGSPLTGRLRPGMSVVASIDTRRTLRSDSRQ